MTEDEAKQKWCPFVRQGDGGGGAFNRGAWGPMNSEHYDPLNIKHNDGTHACNCIGSSCMSWRWRETYNIDTGNFDDKTEGYCGLAGKP